MYLLNTSTLKLEQFIGEVAPGYVILSHTWGVEEISHQDLIRPEREFKRLKGWAKISKFASLAKADGWQYVWADTCCIDQKSSAELSEAINSMFRWYRRAAVCWAYLEDISPLNKTSGSQKRQLRHSRWFQRGWTLQELIAPHNVIFYDQSWNDLGTKQSLRDEISARTGIEPHHLSSFQGASVAAKMSWASSRQTLRPEDIAYCLLGLFDVYMPLLYGEGRIRAFERLQFEILQFKLDASIFAWTATRYSCGTGLLAPGPECFVKSGDIIARPTFINSSPKLVRDGHRLTIELYCHQQVGMDSRGVNDSSSNRYIAPLPYARKVVDNTELVILELAESPDGEVEMIKSSNLQFISEKTVIQSTTYSRRTFRIYQHYTEDYWPHRSPLDSSACFPSHGLTFRLSPSARTRFRLFTMPDHAGIQGWGDLVWRIVPTVDGQYIISKDILNLTANIIIEQTIPPSLKLDFCYRKERHGPYSPFESKLQLKASGEALLEPTDWLDRKIIIGETDRVSISLKDERTLKIMPRLGWRMGGSHLFVDVDWVA